MKKSMQLLLTVTAMLCGSAPAMAQGSAATQPIQEHERSALFPSTRIIEQGRSVAETECAGCHGMDGMGSGEDHPYLAGQRTIYLYRELRAYQNLGRENESMRHVSSILNDDAMLAVAIYYASLTPDREPVAPEAAEQPEPLGDNPFASIQPELKKCIKCHGETGNSTASGMPNLTAQSPEYLTSSMQGYRDGARDHRLMTKLASELDEQTIKQMAIFYAVQQPQRSATAGDGNAAAGKQKAEQCATCHGANGNAGSADVPSLAGQDARYFVKAMQAYKDGKRDHEQMIEAAAGLGDTEFKDLAAHYAQQEPVQRDTRVPFSTAEWVQRCERCHGIDGNSTDPRFPMLAGQNENYLRKAMQAYSKGGRSASVMHAMSEPLSESDIQRIARHYAAQAPKPVVYVQLPCEQPPAE